ncbi:slipin family protein [Flavobacterium amniphilum]|uniref:slipin family protein n=1 Tax=Flavobacterium amniphilum TaxID=1834035 RepID=UPI00202A756B|nr:slipin family protein [Flavobacterium amniphilum]MCL9804409.1 slipin family protein [Flavobacterium amniphilum]
MIQRVKIQGYQVGLVFKNRKLVTILEEGTYWIFGSKKVEKFEMNQPFNPSADLEFLLQNEALKSMLKVVEVPDGQIALQFVNANFKEILPVGKYAFWKGINLNMFTLADLTKVFITEEISKSLLENVRLRMYTRQFKVLNNEKGLLFIDGKFEKELTPGTYYFWNNMTPVEVKTADLRQQQLEISGQELLTKDKAALRINFFVKYQVTDISRALLENKEYDKQLYVLMQLALRAFIGGLTLDELLQKKDALAEIILAEVKEKITTLGVTVSDAGIRDVILPGDMKEIMNQVLVAEKKAQANSIMRREETAATRSLLNTAKLMEENEMLWKLKEMEYVEKIADRIGEITISGGGNVIGQLKEIFVK